MLDKFRRLWETIPTLRNQPENVMNEEELKAVIVKLVAQRDQAVNALKGCRAYAGAFYSQSPSRMADLGSSLRLADDVLHDAAFITGYIPR